MQESRILEKTVCLNLESSKIQPGITRGPKTQQTWNYRGPAEIQNSEISGEPNNASNLNSYPDFWNFDGSNHPIFWTSDGFPKWKGGGYKW